MRRALSLSASVLALICCDAAYAQTASTASSSSVETVVVTAERRTENLMQTPISADVLTGADLTNKGVMTVDQLQFVAPSVAVDNFGQGNDFNIRGIGKGEHNSQTSTGVITYRDGVETYPGYLQEEPYYDVGSIELLRGPQGTFVGSNATGGAVFVKTIDPVIGGGFDGYGVANAGNYDEFGLQGASNIPIDDTLAARFAFFTDERDSFYQITDANPTDNCPAHRYANCKPGYNPGNVRWAAGRFSLLWQPTSALSVLLKTDVGYLDNGAYPADPTSTLGGSPTSPTTTLNTSDPFHITANAPQGAMDRYVRTVLKVDYVFDGYTLRSIAGYQDSSSRYRADLDGTDSNVSPINPFGFNETFFDTVDTTLWSEEVNLISPDTGRVTWILGGYSQWLNYNFLPNLQFDIDEFQPIFIPAFNYQLDGTNPESSYAAFGQVSVKLTDDLKLDLGGRWSTHSTKNDVNVQQFGLFLLDHQKASFSNFSYKASLDWTINEDNFVYGFVASGFKPGGLNVPVGLGQPAPFGSEKVMSFEAGWKATMFDGHLRNDLDAYYNNYDHFQVTIGFPAFPTFGFELNDPHTTKIYGVEEELQATFDQLSFNLGLGLMHSGLGTFYAADPRVTTISTACNTLTGPSSANCFNLGGHPQAYAPNFTFNVGAQYVFALGEDDTLTPRVNFGHLSEQWATLFDDVRGGDLLQARDILGAQLSWTHDTWTATLYGENLTNEHYIAAANSGVRWAGAPLQFGIRLMKSF